MTDALVHPDGSDGRPVVRRGWPGPEPFAPVLERAQGGDERAFAELWRWLHPPLVAWLSYICPGCEEEAASEAWMAVTRRLTTFAGGESEFRSWVFTCARRRAIDAARTRRPTVSLDGANRPEAADPELDPSQVASEISERRQAVDLIRRLPDGQAEVVMLRVVAGLSVAETASATGKSEGAVRVLCHRGLQSLAEILGQSS